MRWAVPFYKGNGRAKVTNKDRLAKSVKGDIDPEKVIESVILLGLGRLLDGRGPPERSRILAGRARRPPQAGRRSSSITLGCSKLFPGYPPELYYKPERPDVFPAARRSR